MPAKILIVDDEKNIVDILRFNLEKEGFETIEAYDGKEAIEKALRAKPDIILLDVMLPIFDGFTVCRKLRERIQTPIIMLTAKEEEVDKILGLEMGADDYVTKPFSPRELIARIKSNLRRSTIESSSQTPDIIYAFDLEIDIARYEVVKNGEVIDLTAREFSLIKFLVQNAGKVFSRETLMEKIWDYEYFGDMRTVDVTVSRLREKLSRNINEYILTKRGVGYYFRKD
ncbi:MAG: response regulator transcription factor [Clostridia bacterium]|nr:response regulator transcription factor [Clostridia bacterium]MBN2882089.1 response regulator transcription factor [Clostridia bacterium]